MFTKFKKIFKLSTWKRWFILFFFFIFAGLFIGLSFAFKTKDTKVSNEYKNGISLVINPVQDDGTPILDETYSNQLLFNLQKRLENIFPDSIITSIYSENNMWSIDITNIDVNDKDIINELINDITNKSSLTLLPINAIFDPEFFHSTSNNNSLFNYATLSGSSYSLSANNLNEFYTWIKDQKLGNKVIVWKNFGILNKIVKNAVENDGYSGTLYEFLFQQKRTPENKPSGENTTTLDTYFFKDELIDPDTNKVYKATDFIVSKNDIEDFSLSSSTKKTITINKDFGVANLDLTNDQIQNEYYDVSFWISSYNLNDYVLAPRIASNGNNAYLFLMISLITIFAFISILVVINYGYLGIISIIILAIIIFLALLMISIFFGDYNSFSIFSILLTLIISTDFIVSFLSKIKKEHKFGNTVAKSTKNTIKNYQKSMYLKSIILTTFMSIFYVVTSSIFNQFSIIILISCLAITIILLPLTIFLSKIFTGLQYFENNSKSISFLKLNKNNGKNNIETNHEMVEFNTEINSNVENNQIKKENVLSDSIIQFSDKNEEDKYNKFEKLVNSKKNVLFFAIFIFVIAMALLLVNFLVSGNTIFNGLNYNNVIQDQININISKADQQIFSNDEINVIKNILINNGINENNINILDLKSFSILINRDFSNEFINGINQQLTNLYDLVIIPVEIVNSDTFVVMRFAMYGILIALIVTCVLVFIWMDWVKAITLFFSFIITGIVIAFIVLFGGIKFDLLLAVAIVSSFILLLSFAISFLSKIHYKLKLSRIELLTKENIKKIVYYEYFKMLKSFLIINGLIAFVFVLCLALLGSLPWQFLLINLLFSSINLLVILLILPKLLIHFEVTKARISRKIIADNFWDTEKIKEQNFKGINDIK